MKSQIKRGLLLILLPVLLLVSVSCQKNLEWEITPSDVLATQELNMSGYMLEPAQLIPYFQGLYLPSDRQELTYSGEMIIGIENAVLSGTVQGQGVNEELKLNIIYAAGVSSQVKLDDKLRVHPYASTRFAAASGAKAAIIPYWGEIANLDSALVCPEIYPDNRPKSSAAETRQWSLVLRYKQSYMVLSQRVEMSHYDEMLIDTFPGFSEIGGEADFVYNYLPLRSLQARFEDNKRFIGKYVLSDETIDLTVDGSVLRLRPLLRWRPYGQVRGISLVDFALVPDTHLPTSFDSSKYTVKLENPLLNLEIVDNAIIDQASWPEPIQHIGAGGLSTPLDHDYINNDHLKKHSQELVWRRLQMFKVLEPLEIGRLEPWLGIERETLFPAFLRWQVAVYPIKDDAPVTVKAGLKGDLKIGSTSLPVDVSFTVPLPVYNK